MDWLLRVKNISPGCEYKRKLKVRKVLLCTKTISIEKQESQFILREKKFLRNIIFVHFIKKMITYNLKTIS